MFLVVSIGAQQKNPFDVRGKTSKSPSESEAIQEVETSRDSISRDTGTLKIPDRKSTGNPEVQSGNPFEKHNTPSSQELTRTLPRAAQEKQAPSTIISGADGGKRDTSIIVLVYSLIMLIILTLAISLDKNRFTAMMKSSINSNYLKTLFRDSKAWTNGQGIVLYLFFLLNAGFAIWLILLKLDSPWSYNLFIIIGAVTLCYVIRHAVLYAMASIFNLGSEVAIHNFSIGLHNMMLGVFLLPFIMAIEFLPGVSYTSFLFGLTTLFLVIYLLRQLKGILSCLGMRGFSPFYFFIYLCAIEIAPVLVAYKMMIGAL